MGRLGKQVPFLLSPPPSSWARLTVGWPAVCHADQQGTPATLVLLPASKTPTSHTRTERSPQYLPSHNVCANLPVEVHGIFSLIATERTHTNPVFMGSCLFGMVNFFFYSAEVASVKEVNSPPALSLLIYLKDHYASVRAKMLRVCP